MKYCSPKLIKKEKDDTCNVSYQVSKAIKQKDLYYENKCLKFHQKYTSNLKNLPRTTLWDFILRNLPLEVIKEIRYFLFKFENFENNLNFH